jgi:hypothetical protein
LSLGVFRISRRSVGGQKIFCAEEKALSKFDAGAASWESPVQPSTTAEGKHIVRTIECVSNLYRQLLPLSKTANSPLSIRVFNFSSNFCLNLRISLFDREYGSHSLRLFQSLISLH